MSLSLIVVLPLPADSVKSAVTINANSCSVFDGNGGFTEATSAHNVVTSNGNGLLSCKGQVTPSATGKTVQFNGSTDMTCGMISNGVAMSTADWKETVSSSGEMILSCYFRK